MVLAAKLAERGEHTRMYRVGAVIKKKGQIIGVGYNSKKTHPIMQRFNPKKTLHAEIAAMINTGLNNVEKSTIYVVRIARNGDYRLSRPCQSCFLLMEKYGVKKVIWSTNDSFDFLNL